jgi:hypothetical protein
MLMTDVLKDVRCSGDHLAKGGSVNRREIFDVFVSPVGTENLIRR